MGINKYVTIEYIHLLNINPMVLTQFAVMLLNKKSLNFKI